MAATSIGAALTPLPLVGRTNELALLASALDDGDAGRGGAVFLAGEGGVGKTRLAAAVADLAARRGWSVAAGRAYPVEQGVPFALFADAFVPLLRRMDAARLQVLTRGGAAELAQLFPVLAPEGERRSPARGDSTELKARLQWTFSQLLGRLASKQPMLVVLENLQWADASSLELLHFASRQCKADKVVFLCTYNVAERDLNPALRSTEQSLVSLGVARSQTLEPLSRAAVDELVVRALGGERGASREGMREFAALLYGWTRGNVFFLEETLKSLVEQGRLVQRDGAWHGLELESIELPRTVRDAVVARIERLTQEARTVANLAAVIGTRASYDAIVAVSAMPAPALLSALDELRRQRILVEAEDGDAPAYDFGHPIIQDTLYQELGRARARLLHATVAEALEAFYGKRAAQHADELAFHYSRADQRALAPKAAKYLAAAGRGALARSANREASSYLASALEQIDRDGTPQDGLGVGAIVEDLARARQRLGEYDAALALWTRARAEAEQLGETARLGAIERRIGLACYWMGRWEDALAHYEAGLAAAATAGDERLRARLLLATGSLLLEVGRGEEARAQVEEALGIAERLGDGRVLARVHRALLVLHVFTGPPDEARAHGERAISLAAEHDEPVVAWSAHWAMAMLAGLTGHAEGVARHVAESDRVADELRSPVLKLWTAEVAIEYASGTGDWESGLALGERTIATARALSQRTLLPRLLVWTGLMYLGRGDLERAKRNFDEAWHLSGADGSRPGRPLDVHTVVPAHVGMAAYHLYTHDYRRAIRIGELGLEIADRTGYVAWAIHRLVPAIAEASLWIQDWERAEKYGARMRRESEALGHPLGLAWADACFALIRMLKGDKAGAVAQLADAADQLDAIPFVEHGARLRRKLADAMYESGDREGALRELRRIHDVFAKLGAERDLTDVREKLRLLGARPPVRVATQGVAGLTGREVEIARLVAARKSNKQIGTALGISPRTVSTHLSNIFEKLNVTSRGELTDLVREQGLPTAVPDRG